jgi:hypothetical protein
MVWERLLKLYVDLEKRFKKPTLIIIKIEEKTERIKKKLIINLIFLIPKKVKVLLFFWITKFKLYVIEKNT